MTGAIIGEIFGNANVGQQEVPGNFPLFPTISCFSEDTVLSIALADALVNNKEYTMAVSAWEERYHDEILGLPMDHLPDTLTLPENKNKIETAAIHAYLTGYAFYRLDDVLEQSARIARISHDHYANTHVAQAVASAVFLTNSRFSKRYIKAFFEDEYNFDLSVPYTELKESYSHNDNPMVSVYRALISLLQSADFDGALRISFSIGDLENKQTFITGAIAEAFYQDYPDASVSHIMHGLPKEMQKVVKAFNRKFRVKAKERFYENMA